MSATYYLILTAYGAQRIAQLQADQSSAPLAVNFVAGDANGQPYLPQTRIAATALLNQRASVPLQSVDVVDDDNCQAIAVLDATVGGFNIHEIGITDGTGQLVYIGNYHGGYKPALSEGAGGDLTLVLDLVASGLATVIISPDASFIYAGRDWVDANFVSIPTFNAHIAQNTLEHANLLSLINSVNQRISDLEDIKIGDLYITVINFTDAAAVAAHKGYGTWQRFGNGHSLVAVAHGNNTIAPPQLFDIRDTLSELTVELDTVTTHLNIPPSIVIGVWERIT